jgi:hypothetical protein
MNEAGLSAKLGSLDTEIAALEGQFRQFKKTYEGATDVERPAVYAKMQAVKTLCEQRREERRRVKRDLDLERSRRGPDIGY